MFDTHCHLNFKRFKKNLDEVIKKSILSGVEYFVVPGTDIKTSKKAVEVASKRNNIYAAVGVHPHHVYKLKSKNKEETVDVVIDQVNELLRSDKVVAVGEVGLDKHIYVETVYKTYRVDNVFISLQKQVLIKQIKLAIEHSKSLILHNREAVDELLEVLNNNWTSQLSNKTVFHCCEPDKKLLEFAKQHSIFIGVDGDITYDKVKQDFIKSVPLNLLVLETDSPYLLPEPLRSKRLYPNTPANLNIVAKYIAKTLGEKLSYIQKQTLENGLRLFNLESYKG